MNKKQKKIETIWIEFEVLVQVEHFLTAIDSFWFDSSNTDIKMFLENSKNKQKMNKNKRKSRQFETSGSVKLVNYYKLDGSSLMFSQI